MTFTTQKFITAMESAEKERVEFARTIVPADAHGLVERWLQQVNRTVDFFASFFVSLNELYTRNDKLKTKISFISIASDELM